MSFAEAVTRSLERSAPEERYGLTAQLRRSAIGIPSHISEGHQHTNRHYVTIALGAQAECETQLELAKRLHSAPADKIDPVIELAARVGRILHGLMRSLPET
jgi:four helix bundle protein